MLGVIIHVVIVIAKGNECQLKQTEASRILKTKRTLGKNKPNSYGLVFFPNYKSGIVMS
jgi:hypothetical protein